MDPEAGGVLLREGSFAAFVEDGLSGLDPLVGGGGGTAFGGAPIGLGTPGGLSEPGTDPKGGDGTDLGGTAGGDPVLEEFFGILGIELFDIDERAVSDTGGLSGTIAVEVLLEELSALLVALALEELSGEDFDLISDLLVSSTWADSNPLRTGGNPGLFGF